MFFLILIPGLLYSQANDVLDQFLSKDKADFSTSAYLVLSAAGIVPEDVPPAVAIQALKQKNWGISITTPEREILWGDYSLLLMKAFNLPSGLMYKIFPGTRYGTREINFKKYLTYSKGEGETVTPFEALLALQTLMEDRGVQETVK